ncbi:Sedlin [Tribonema minus]|uniref:Trafficking protein particle complex subunit 2-like protein n=1 Tax=Tribonema minus TaxID=303371 RepID=A0A836CHF0_9STRA|nr:Sedlin [Tribonema minus]
MIVCLAVISKANAPLLVRTYVDPSLGEDQADTTIRFHHIVHTSLDVVQEARAGDRHVPACRRWCAATRDMFLGHLCPMDEYEVYGYVTSTQVKILAVLEETVTSRKSELAALLHTIHGFYVNYQLNPFSPLNQPIGSERFKLAVDRQVNGYNADIG